jgi:hypothetical protein
MKFAYDLKIHALLKRIDFVPMDHHKPSLYEFLRFELFDVIPEYCWTPMCPYMPKYYNIVLKNIKKL